MATRARNIDLPEVELEQWIVRDRFDHPPDLGPRDDRADSGAERLVGGDLPGEGTDAQLVVVGTRQGMDHAPGISPEVPALGRRARDGREQPPVRQDRAEGVHAWAAVAPDGPEIADGEPGRALGEGPVAV